MLATLGVVAAGAAAPYGSSNFGAWTSDRWELPASVYTGHPSASSLPAGHAPLVPVAAHQVGNDRLVGVAYTNGELSVRQDEGGAKLLHMYSEPDFQFRGGYGYLTTDTGALVASSRAAATASS